MALIDVVIPTYNGLPFLCEAIESALAQTHAPNRIFVVDDGSTDETHALIRSLADERIEYIRKARGGPSSARNIGIRASTSPYVALLDSDDRWYPEKLERQLHVIESCPDIALVHGFQHTVDDDGRVLGDLKHDLRGRVFDRLLSGNFVTGSDSMVLLRRAALDRVGLFREDIVIGEDWELWLRLAHDYVFDYVPDHLAAIRAREGLQSDRERVAANLVRVYDVVGASMPLRRRQRATLARACLGIAAYDYALADQPERSFATLWRLVRVSPLAVFRMRMVGFYLHFVIHVLRRGPRTVTT
jgi:glycosyltransferase involved in cell wall biosynthesis